MPVQGGFTMLLNQNGCILHAFCIHFALLLGPHKGQGGIEVDSQYLSVHFYLPLCLGDAKHVQNSKWYYFWPKKDDVLHPFPYFYSAFLSGAIPLPSWTKLHYID